MEENVLLLSELSAIQKVAEFPKEYADGIKYLTVSEMKLILAQPDPGKKTGLRDVLSLFMIGIYSVKNCRIFSNRTGSLIFFMEGSLRFINFSKPIFLSESPNGVKTATSSSPKICERFVPDMTSSYQPAIQHFPADFFLIRKLIGAVLNKWKN